MYNECAQALDRDYPNGSEVWQVLIQADDEGGLNTATEVWITLEDINDNAPFLRMVGDQYINFLHSALKNVATAFYVINLSLFFFFFPGA